MEWLLPYIRTLNKQGRSKMLPQQLLAAAEAAEAAKQDLDTKRNAKTDADAAVSRAQQTAQEAGTAEAAAAQQLDGARQSLLAVVEALYHLPPR